MTEQIILYPTADAFITSANPNTNYGSGSLLSYGIPSRRSNIKFNLSTISTANLIEARIYYYCAAGAGSGVTHRRCTQDWSEETITWNNQPTYSAVNMGSTPNFKYTSTWYSAVLDLTEFATMVTTNYGMCGLGTNDDASNAYSRSGSAPPKLVLTYTSIPTTSYVIIFSG